MVIESADRAKRDDLSFVKNRFRRFWGDPQTGMRDLPDRKRRDGKHSHVDQFIKKKKK